MILSGYLSWTALNNQSVKGCDVGSGCDVVLHSPWATTLGIPTASWGFFTYAALAAIAYVRRVDRQWQLAWVVSLFGLLFSVYLTTVSMAILKAACPYCLTSLALMTAIFALVTWQRPESVPLLAWGPWLARTAPVAVGLIAILHLQYTGVVTPAGQTQQEEDPLARALAEHLTRSGVKFYGASWCPHCQQQKALFGAAAKYLPYIECSTGGVGTPQTQVCIDMGIKSYPTWIVNGQRVEEVLSMTQLANATNFKAPGAAGQD